MNLNALEDFLLVAAHGGLGKASRASGRSKATLSRRIADLEEALGVRLLERGSNRLILTEAGQLLLARAEDPMREVGEAVTAAREGLAMPRGRLRVAAPLLFSQLAFGQLGARFLAAYPDVQLDVVAQDRAVDLVEEHFDVAIRVNPREDSTLVGRCFAKDRLVIAAAPSIKMPRAGKAGKPVQVPAVVLSSYAGEPWPLDRSRLVIDPQPVMRASSLLIVRDAALAGVGVAVLPRSIIGSRLKSGELVQWATTGKVVELWALHTSRRLPSAKVRAFVDFMRDQYPDGELVLEG
ncbi:MAG: LysR family transcriptional regulator [Burkholderiaceae bacterium]|jgi:DNA-binding transcriptional LysR family regulator|nr:MAG: LysR family transcriptional regulator [Burkholderiaceae bacterium]